MGLAVSGWKRLLASAADMSDNPVKRFVWNTIMKAISGSIIVAASLVCLTLAPFFIASSDTQTFVMACATVVGLTGLGGWMVALVRNERV